MKCSVDRESVRCQFGWPHCFHAPPAIELSSPSKQLHRSPSSAAGNRVSRHHPVCAALWPGHFQTTDIKLSSTYRAYSYTIVIIITQLYENVSSVIDHPRQHHPAAYENNGDLGAGVSVDNVSLATTIIDAALNYTAITSSTAAADSGNNDTQSSIPEIPAYIRTTSMVFCITIMFLGVIGNIMVSVQLPGLRSRARLFIDVASSVAASGQCVHAIHNNLCVICDSQTPRVERCSRCFKLEPSVLEHSTNKYRLFSIYIKCNGSWVEGIIFR